MFFPSRDREEAAWVVHTPKLEVCLSKAILGGRWFRLYRSFSAKDIGMFDVEPKEIGVP